MGKVWPRIRHSGESSGLDVWVEAGGGPGCHASDMGNPGEVHHLEAVGGGLAVNIMSQVSSQESCRAACTPCHVLSCPSQGVTSPSWEVIPSDVSLEAGLASERNHTHIF